MKVARTLLSFCALGLAGSALAADYPEERGVVPSVVPAAPDESGIVRNVPSRGDNPVDQPVGADRSVDGYFSRYDTNRDGVISRGEAQRDADLVAVFDRADSNRDQMLSRAEFEDAAVLAVNENRALRGG